MRAERRAARAAGFTLAEILVSLALVGLLATALLAAAQTQISLYRDQTRMQAVEENARAALDVVGHDARLIGAPSRGWGVVNDTVGGPPALWIYKVVNNYSSFDADGVHGADRLELVVPVGEMVVLSSAVVATAQQFNLVRLDPASINSPTARPPTLDFVAGDYVLLSNVSVVAPGSPAAQVPPAPLQYTPLQPLCSVTTVGSLLAQVSSVVPPAMLQLTKQLDTSGCSFPAGSLVGRARVAAYYIDGQNQLVMDEGAQLLGAGLKTPVAESIADFQIAIGVDGANGQPKDGVLTEVGLVPNDDEWVLNVDGETLLGAGMSAAPLQVPTALRLTIVARTPSPDAASGPGRPRVEDHAAGPPDDGYHYRVLTTTIVPRNLVQP